jgi:hypothetical protein
VRTTIHTRGVERSGGVCTAIGFRSGAVECGQRMPSFGVEQDLVTDTPYVVATQFCSWLARDQRLRISP